MINRAHARYSIQVKRLEASFIKTICSDDLMRRPERYYIFEGLLSHSWQAWCGFCRMYCINYVSGFRSNSGTLIPQKFWATNTDEAVFNLKRIANGNAPVRGYAGRMAQRHEITWGDADKLLEIFIQLSAVHERRILTFPEVQSIKDMQRIRNCTAHITKENRTEVLRVSTSYVGSAITHPTDLLMWESRTSRDYAFVAWLHDSKYIADSLMNQ